jgi:hypothetical protein
MRNNSVLRIVLGFIEKTGAGVDAVDLLAVSRYIKR